MKFNLKDFIELDTDGLLAVNGGSNCGGGSSGPSGSSSGGEPSGGSTGGPGNGGGNSGGSGGDSSGGNGSSSNSTSGNSGYRVTENKDGTITVHQPDGHSFTYSRNNKKQTTSGSGSRGGYCSGASDGTTRTKNPYYQDDDDGDDKGGTNKPGSRPDDAVPVANGGCGKISTPSKPKVPVEPPATTPEKSTVERLLEQIYALGDPKDINTNEYDPGEKKYCYKPGSYQCDEYVEEIVRKAGFNPNDYFVDNPSGKYVTDHINELKKSNKAHETDATKLTEGAYVVFMSDADNKVGAHASLLFVNSDGSAFMYDNSSHNFKYGKDLYYGGIEKTTGNSALDVCNAFISYENFYFQKI